MPRSYTEEDMQKALRAAENGIPLGQAAKQHRIPRQTLQDRLRGKSSSMGVAMEQYQRIPRDKEKQIYDWVLGQAAKGKSPTFVQIAQRASFVLRESGDTIPLSGSWINGFIRRFPLATPKRAEAHVKDLFWESTKMDEESSERAITSLRAFILKGLHPQELLGVQALSEQELSISDDNSSLTMVCRETGGTGLSILSTGHLRTLREEYKKAASSWVNFVEAFPDRTKHGIIPSRIMGDPGHSNVEWSVFENITMSLTEQALHSNGRPRPIFRKTLDISGKVKLQCKTNKQLEMEHLGQIVGRNWFIRPSVTTLNIYSALFAYNQIKFRASELDERDNMLPWIYIKTYVGCPPANCWTRYISSHNGEAHMQFHARYITPEPTATTEPGGADQEEGFCISRRSYYLGRTIGATALLSEGRLSVAMKTTTNVPESYYSAVILSDSGAFQEAACGEVWDEKIAPPNCGRLTGIAVFQAILYQSLMLCKEEYIKTANEVAQRLTRLDEFNISEAKGLITDVLEIIGQTTNNIKMLAKDCQENVKKTAKQGKGNQAIYDNSIEKRWRSLISTQEEIGEKLSAIFLKLRDDLPCCTSKHNMRERGCR